VDYLRAYAEHFCVRERIHLESKVVKISRDSDGGHLVSYVTKRAERPDEWESCKTQLLLGE
jgi:dimethylaniline monooxygenase (N-oxide forming)